MSKIDLALVGARIRTLDSERPAAAALAIADGEIVAVGSDAEIRELGAATETVDLQGAVVVPGLTDSHIHPLEGALDTRGADLRDLTSLEDVREAVAAERQSCAPGQWVLGFGLEYGVFRESGIRGELFDNVVEGAPALLTFMDLHSAVATPRAKARRPESCVSGRRWRPSSVRCRSSPPPNATRGTPRRCVSKPRRG